MVCEFENYSMPTACGVWCSTTIILGRISPTNLDRGPLHVKLTPGSGHLTGENVHDGLAVSNAISRIERGRTQNRNLSELYRTLLNEQAKASA